MIHRGRRGYCVTRQEENRKFCRILRVVAIFQNEESEAVTQRLYSQSSARRHLPILNSELLITLTYFKPVSRGGVIYLIKLPFCPFLFT